jgi:hypothetical protein
VAVPVPRAGTFKAFLLVVLYCVLIAGVAYGVGIILGALPFPFMDTLTTIVYIVAGLAILYLIGRFLISLLPD